MIYLASPYSHPNQSFQLERFEAAQKFTAKAITRGHIIFSPIVHCHYLALLFEMPSDFQFWNRYNFGMLAAAKELWVLKLEGWEESLGVNGEIEFATRKRLAVTYVKADYF